jgi:hypothetical protein
MPQADRATRASFRAPNDLPLSRRRPQALAVSRDGLPAVGSNGLLGDSRTRYVPEISHPSTYSPIAALAPRCSR